jgi:uncharacterized protein
MSNTSSSSLVSSGLAALLLAAGIGAAGYAVSEGLQRFSMADRTVTVKGLAEKAVESDYAIWLLSFRRAGNDFGGVQETLKTDRQGVIAFLKSHGFSDSEIEIKPLKVQDLLTREYAQDNVPFRYNGNGQVWVKTERVKNVEKTALALDPLIQSGVQLEGDVSVPRYQLRGFNDVKAQLLSEATKNAKEQASKFAAEAGASLGQLKNANQGVIRMAGDDGSESDDGSSRVKRLRVVSTFEYTLK